MQRDSSREERAKQAHLQHQPEGSEACENCSFYEPVRGGAGYCAKPQVRQDVGPDWWCVFWERQESRVKVGGHPLHPMLVMFPLALTSMGLVFDVLGAVTGRPGWRKAANQSIWAGTIGGLLAAPAGTLDWLAIPSGRAAKNFGLIHGIGNALLLGLNGVNLGLRSGIERPSPAQRAREISLSALANALSLITGWLGGELVYRFGIGVETPDAPYRILDVEPVIRLDPLPEMKGGEIHLPEQSLWTGPAELSEGETGGQI